MLTLSVSNIGWDASLDQNASKLLRSFGVIHVDLAPSRYPGLSAAAIKTHWSNLGFDIIGMQSLLFGTDVNMFNEPDAFFDKMTAVIEVSDVLGAKRLTFGSPKNRRIRDNTSRLNAENIAIDLLSNLGQRCAETGRILCVEPNPVEYGCNFLTTLAETISLVEAINHPNIRIQIDTGAVIMNDEIRELEDLVNFKYDLIGHIHISEPHLAPLGSSELSSVLNVLDGRIGVATIEVKDTGNGNLDHIFTSINFMSKR